MPAGSIPVAATHTSLSLTNWSYIYGTIGEILYGEIGEKLYGEIRLPMANLFQTIVTVGLKLFLEPFKCQPHKIAKHTQTICRQQPFVWSFWGVGA